LQGISEKCVGGDKWEGREYPVKEYQGTVDARRAKARMLPRIRREKVMT